MIGNLGNNSKYYWQQYSFSQSKLRIRGIGNREALKHAAAAKAAGIGHTKNN